MQIYHISAVQIGSGRPRIIRCAIICCFGRFVMFHFMFLRHFTLDFSAVQRGINADFRNKNFCALRIATLQSGPEYGGSPHSDLNIKSCRNTGGLLWDTTSHPKSIQKKKTTPLMIFGSKLRFLKYFIDFKGRHTRVCLFFCVWEFQSLTLTEDRIILIKYCILLATIGCISVFIQLFCIKQE